MLTLDGHPDWSLTMWSWVKGKIWGSVRVPLPTGAVLRQCSFHPQDSQQIVLIGDGILRLFRLQDGQLKPVAGVLGSSATLAASGNNSRNRTGGSIYVSHAWLMDGRLLVGTAGGELLLFESTGEYKMTLNCSPYEPRSCMTIIAFSGGFLVGGADAAVRVYLKTANSTNQNQQSAKSPNRSPKRVEGGDGRSFTRDPFKRALELRVEAGAGSCVSGLAVQPNSEDVCSIVTSNGQIMTMPLSSGDITKAEEIPTLDFPLTSFHSGPINGIASCVRKPLICTVGADKTVRIWDYNKGVCRLMKQFNEEPLSVSFHPSGLHLLVGFSDKLRLLNVLLDNLQPYKEFAIKGCSVCKFSNGGHLFAAVNSTTIQVYKTYTGEIATSIRAHHGRVRDLNWAPDDSCLSSCGQDGCVFEHVLQLGGGIGNSGTGAMVSDRKESNCVDWSLKGSIFHSVCLNLSKLDSQTLSADKSEDAPQMTNSLNTVFVSGTDRTLKEIEGNRVIRSAMTDSILSCLTLSNVGVRALFAVACAAVSGLPGTKNNAITTSIALNNNSKGKSPFDTLATAGDTNVVTEALIHAVDGSNQLQAPSWVRTYAYPLTGDYAFVASHATPTAGICLSNDEAYIFSAGRDGSLFIFEVKPLLPSGSSEKSVAQADDLLASRREKELPPAEDILITRQFVDDMDSRVSELQRQVAELETQIDFQLHSKETNHKEKRSSLEDKYTREVEEERTRKEILKEEINDMQLEFEENLQTIRNQHKKHLAELDSDFQQKLLQEAARYQRLQQLRDQELHDRDREFGETERQFEVQVLELKKSFEEKKVKFDDQIKDMISQKESTVREHTEILKQLEDESDSKADQLRESEEALLLQERYQKLKYLAQATVSRRTFDEQLEQVKHGNAELQAKQKAIEKQRADNAALKKECDAFRKEVSERLRTLRDKEARIEELKRQNQELEKFKFVLDYKIKELKSQLDPKSLEILKMRDSVEAMNTEVAECREDMQKKERDINVIRLKLTGLTRDHRKQQQTILEQSDYLKRLRTEMLSCFTKAHLPRPHRISADSSNNITNAIADGDKTPQKKSNVQSPSKSAKITSNQNSPSKQQLAVVASKPNSPSESPKRIPAAPDTIEFIAPSVSVALANYSAQENHNDIPSLSLQKTKELKAAVADLFRKFVADEDDCLQRAITRTGRIPSAALAGLSIVRHAFGKYSSVDLQQSGGNDESDEANDALARCKYLEKTIESLKDQLRKDAELHKSENLKAMKENKILLGEINALRRHYQMLSHEINKPDNDNNSSDDDNERFSPTLLAE